MAAYPIPPWIQPSDPASAYAQGMQIGTRIGSEQSRQATEQAAIDRQTQMQAVEEARKEAEFGLKQQAAARRYAAQAKYQSLLNQGIDPAKALLQVAPDLGESLTGAAQLYKAGQPTETLPLTIEERDGEKFYRTGNTSWQHVPKPAETQVRYFHNTDGTVTKISPDGTLETLGEPNDKHATVKYDKSDIGPAISGPANSPEIVARQNAIAKALAKEEEEKNKPSMIEGALNALRYMGSPSGIPAAPPADSTKKKLTKDQAKAFLKQAGGDKEKARQLAKDAGYDF